jgi:hypothetical protein
MQNPCGVPYPFSLQPALARNLLNPATKFADYIDSSLSGLRSISGMRGNPIDGWKTCQAEYVEESSWEVDNLG